MERLALSPPPTETTALAVVAVGAMSPHISVRMFPVFTTRSIRVKFSVVLKTTEETAGQDPKLFGPTPIQRSSSRSARAETESDVERDVPFTASVVADWNSGDAMATLLG